ncbi:hypothetical protein QN354_02095 [Cryobacterium sp. 5I3]|uniref:hypothetical protein n=1 Tax=Cryobacterium sp. 5I3 TaxID=3048592 RepID=UPI002B2242DE|nr:hypothetical protein [Cryobacterium sp. 5I3]MEB0200545.1 hypothetical protein [Cryobacterium sp. 5I3]
MAKVCSVCVKAEAAGVVVDESRSRVAWALELGVGKTSIGRHLAHASVGPARRVAPAKTSTPAREAFDVDGGGNVTASALGARIIPLSEWLDKLRADGFDPDDFVCTFGHSIWDQRTRPRELAEGEVVPEDDNLTVLYANRFTATRRASAESFPLWPVVQPGPRLVIKPLTITPRTGGRWKTAVLMADTQIGYRLFEDGTLDPFHDEAAMSVALQIVQLEQPDRTVVMGDIIDLPEQSRWAQEAAFANTTQPAIDRTTRFGGELRCATPYDLDWIEGNHDKRFQNFVEANARSAFGIRKGESPSTWPVMSMPNLLRLDEQGITYHDAYPAAHVWINDTLRCEHGTKVNSNGSTAQKYLNETPHISRAFGHTHRLEMVSRTTWDRAGKIRSVGVNPGCLCRLDGAVPSVHGAIGATGRPAPIVEDWQHGVAVIRYTERDFRVELVQIDDGLTFHRGQEIRAMP